MDFTKINPKNIYTLSKYGAFDLNGDFFITGRTEVKIELHFETLNYLLSSSSFRKYT